MNIPAMNWPLILGLALFSGSALAYDCSDLSKWKRQAYYPVGAQVQYLDVAYENTGEPSKRDYPDNGYPWDELGPCDSSGGDGGGGGEDPPEPEPISIYGAWHCGDDYCTWSRDREMAEFDGKNHWLINRGSNDCNYKTAESCNPSVNLVVLSFVHPLRLLHDTVITDEGGCAPCGVPVGMTEEVVNYFKNPGIRVMLSIGGITYVDPWNQALDEDAWQLGLNAAAVAKKLGVGIEIDYEENRNPNLDGLQSFIDAYRSVHPYDPSGNNHAARLTIDLAAGDRWLIALTERATAEWLRTDDPDTPEQEQVLDYANAMVTPRQSTADKTTANWQEHIDGKPQYDPPIPPLAPAKLTGSLWLTGRQPAPECVDFNRSLQHPDATGTFVQTITPNGAGATHGMLGFMFWAAECQGTRAECTTPEYNNTCENGMGAAAAHYEIPIPMEALRQQ
jgi:hypothetical protein